MAKYVKKHVDFKPIEAFRWTGDRTQREDPEWVTQAIKQKRIRFGKTSEGGIRMIIDAPEGCYVAQGGDYIIKGEGEKIYPMSRSSFNQIYELAE